jgi:serine/threonine protein phosphatase 1
MSHVIEEIDDHCRIFAIGDIHGCSVALRVLIDAIKPGPDDLIVVLGDFLDCGPDSRGVIEQLIALSNQCRLITILGNHEAMLINALDSPSELRYWLGNGGNRTLASYSTSKVDLDVIPPEHVAFIRRCRNYFETKTHIFTHANFDPVLPPHQPDGDKLRWEQLDMARLRPHRSGKTVVVGHTAQSNGSILDLGFLIGIDTDCFRDGWLTALDFNSGDVIQTNESGRTRRYSRSDVKS